MTLLIELESDFGGSASRTLLVNGSADTDYTVLADGTSLGATVATPMFAKTIDNVGITVTGELRQEREQQLNVLVESADTATLQNKLDALFEICDQIQKKGGGTLNYRSANGSYVNRFRVKATKVVPGELWEYEGFVRSRVQIALMVESYGLSDPYDISDSFATDTLGVAGKYNRYGSDWTKRAGATAAVANGILTAPNTTGVTTYVHTGTPHTWGDLQVDSKVIMTTRTTNAVMGLILKEIDSSNYIYGRILDDGANSILSIRKVTAGVDAALTTPITVNLAARITSGADNWLRVRMEGNVVYAEHWLTKPTPTGTPTNSVSGTLSAAEALVFGASIRGRAGLIYNGLNATTIIYDDFNLRANCYRSWTFPDVISMNSTYGGTVDAQAGVYYTGTSTAPTWIMFSWWQKPSAYNYIWNGAGEVVGTTSTVAYGWVATAVSGICGAATTVTRGTTAANIRLGNAYIEIVCPATSDTAATFQIHKRFKKGVTYTVGAWLRAAAGTTVARVKLGISGDVATSTNTALSTTWTYHTTTWTPTADTDFAYFAAGIGAATGTTFQLDGAYVYEGIGSAPDHEHGGWGPGVVHGASYDSAKASISTDGSYWTVAADATYTTDYRTRGTGAMTTTANLEYFIRPDLFTPDDFAVGEVDIAVYARCEIAQTQTTTGVSGAQSAISCVLSVAPESGTTFGQRKYSEFRSTGKILKAPITNSAFKPYYLGTVTCKVDRTNPARWKLRLAFTNGASSTGVFGIDYLILVPAKNIAQTRTGCAESAAPTFIGTTSQITKFVNNNLSVFTLEPSSVISDSHTFPDGSIGGENIRIPESAEMLIWPTNMVVDGTDSSASTMAIGHTATAQVAVQPIQHLLRQG